MEFIGSIGGVWRYPVKSLAGEPLARARLDETGIIGDRRWALKNTRTGELVNCKVLTSLLTIGASYREEPVAGHDVAHARITLPDGRLLMTSDPSVNGAISAIAGQPLELWPLLPSSNTEHYRLRRPFTPELTRQRMGLKPNDPYPDFSTYEPEMIAELQHFFSPRGSYKDAYPLHYVTSASLATLESFHPGLDVTPRRFRPNFFIEGVEGGGFPELAWSGYDLVIGDAVLSCGEETVRCVMPSQAQMGLKAEPHMGFVLNRVTQLKFGAYCHIRKPGTIAVGDEVFLERRPKFQPIRSKLLPLPETMARGEIPAPPPLAPFYRARVVRKQRETADTVTFGLKMKSGELFPFLPGQHLIFRLAPASHARPLMRSYSLISAAGGAEPHPAEDYAITVKRIGTGSAYLHDEVEVGAELDVRWPSGRFFAVPESDTPIALIGNGIGITPLFSMLRTIARVNPTRRVFWLHATRNSTTHLFRQEVASLGRELAGFHEWTIYRQPRAGDVAGRDYHSSERIAPEHFSALVNLPDLEAFICGSESFTSGAQAMMRELGVRAERIHTEKFFSTLRWNAIDDGKRADSRTFAIRFERSGVEAQWSEGDPTLLEIAEQAGISADYGCRFGACLACSTRVVKGAVKYADPEIVPKPGETLICCAVPTSDLVLDL